MLLDAGARGRAQDVVPGPSAGAEELESWPVLPCPRPPGRDVALDLLRGLAMAILVVNHAQIPSWLAVATGTVLSAAEILVPVSGVAVGMVYGRRWRRLGGREASLQLLRRARKLYVASVVVVALVGAATLVPGLAVEAAAVSRDGRDLYASDGALDLLLSIVTLEAGPWQFNILGFFVIALALAPLALVALARGRAAALLAGSVGVYLVGRTLNVDVLPTQSEGPFPLLVWQMPFVVGMVVGFHRLRVEAVLRRARRPLVLAIGATATAAACLQTGLAPEPALEWKQARFDKGLLDPLRLAVMVSLGIAVYALLRRFTAAAERATGWLLLPLGRCSFYVFIVHVPLCIALASVPVLAGDGLGPIANSVVLAASVALLAELARREVLFRWIPR